MILVLFYNFMSFASWFARIIIRQNIKVCIYSLIIFGVSHIGLASEPESQKFSAYNFLLYSS